MTAQRREEDIQRVPIAISAIGAEELAQRGIQGFADLGGGKVASLRMQPFAGNQTQLQVGIRWRCGFPESGRHLREPGSDLYR